MLAMNAVHEQIARQANLAKVICSAENTVDNDSMVPSETSCLNKFADILSCASGTHITAKTIPNS